MLKAFLGCAAAATAAFVFMGLQTGAFGPNRSSGAGDEKQDVQAAPAKKPVPARGKFPEDLAPATRAQPVPAAAEYKVAIKPHKLAFLKPNGAPHKWMDDAVGYSENWAAASVEETELVVVVSAQTRTMIQRATFVNGPPIDRYRYELDASVIEAKTGKLLAHRMFVNMPRTIARRELYEVTELGSPVKYLTVFNWVSGQSQGGFSATVNATPFVTVVERQ